MSVGEIIIDPNVLHECRRSEAMRIQMARALESPIFYHATLKKHVAKIERLGLRPRKLAKVPASCPTEKRSPNHVVCFFDNELHARSFAESLSAWNDWEEAVVIEVDLSGLRVCPDLNWDILDAFQVSATVTPDRIKRVIAV